MFSTHNINSNTISIRNLILLFLTIVLGFASVITLAQIDITSDIENARQTIAHITVTSDGTNAGELEMDISFTGIYINSGILADGGNFSGKVLGIDDNGNLVYAYSNNLVVSGAGGGVGVGGDGHRTGDNGADIRNLNNGNVGIGTSIMSGKLHIKSAGTTDVYIEDTNPGSAANINFKNTVNRWMVGGYSDRFYIGLNGNAFVNIITGGYVGIGTTGPKAPLQVIGNFIAGEYSNTIISGTNSSIAGGRDNSIDKDYDFIGGGSGNVISGSTHSNIIGGEINKIETNIPSKGSRSSIVGGNNNNILYANFASIVGGAKNIIDGSENAFIGGGISGSIITSVNSFIGGGYKNIISGGSNNFIGGGNGNIIYKSNKSSIGGGDSNTITGNSNYSTIPGGFFNEINNAIYSFAVGVRAKANSNNSFVWNSDNGADFTSIKTGTFIINVPWGSSPDKGGVGINTNNPEALLDVNGKIKAKNIELDKRSPTVTSGGSCGGENPGTIIYDGVGFYGCGPSNTRKRLD